MVVVVVDVIAVVGCWVDGMSFVVSFASFFEFFGDFIEFGVWGLWCWVEFVLDQLSVVVDVDEVESVIVGIGEVGD